MKTKNIVKEKSKYLTVDNFLDKNIKELFIDLFNYRKDPNKIFLFVILLPITSFFLILNLFFFIFFFINYLIIFCFYIVKIKYFKKERKKIIKFEKRFKFLKNYYLIILEKIILCFPRKKAFLLLYVILKKIIKKEEKFIEKDLIIDWVRAISNRYLLSAIIGLPYIILYCNHILVKTIKNSEGLNYESRKAYINTIILNIYKNLIPAYTKLVEKLKIIIKTKSITFNSKKEIIKALKNKKEFIENFNKLKKELVYGLAKNKTSENEYSKFHPTVILKTKENILIYSNETSKEKLKIWTFMKDVEKKNFEKWKEEEIKNNFKHEGSIKKIETYYTDLIKTEKQNIIIKDPFKDQFLKKDIYNENINNITANFTLNLNKELIKTTEIEKNGEKKYILTKEKIDKNFISWVKENQGKISNESFEALMEIDYFWKTNEVLIENLNLKEKLELAQILNVGIEEFKNPKEINFKIFISFVSKDFKS